MVPPVALALKPATKLRDVTLPFRTFRPLNEAAFTASVSCLPSEASDVLMLPIWAPGSVACVSAVVIELMVVMTELIAELAVARSDCPCDRASLEADTTPLSELSWVGDRPIGRIVGGGGDVEAGRNLDSERCSATAASSARTAAR